jgi:hypothetical protein
MVRREPPSERRPGERLHGVRRPSPKGRLVRHERECVDEKLTNTPEEADGWEILARHLGLVP